MKYYSFSDKIKDYHVRKLQLSQLPKNKTAAEKAQREYNALTKAKKDIKDKAEEAIEGALLFSKIIQWSRLQDRKDHKEDPVYKDIARESQFANYAAVLDKDREIRLEFEKENKKFVKEIFSEDRLSRIIDSIFYNNYSDKESDKEYRVRIAELMLTKSIFELTINHLRKQPQLSRLLENDLNRVLDIARFIRYQNVNPSK